jgi:NAD(P)-dependent dehydrogenase (short-subunit alcohol dehydrogenase family)
MRLRDKVALITGAGSGIGMEAALLFSSEGAGIVAVDVNDDAGKETVKQIEAKGGKAIFYVHADVSKGEDCNKMVAAAEQTFGKLNILFNNAGIMDSNDDNAMTTEEAVW